MDKDSGHYCYETYPSVTKTNTNSLKSIDNKMKKKKEIKTCDCFGSKKRKAFFTGLATNIGICILLFGYTLIGSVVFLAIEGGNTIQHHILATTSMATNLNYKKPAPTNGSYELKTKTDDIRARTVENIWDITVNLNILYRDNWTRLAAQEITRFQDELLKSLSEDYLEYPVVERKVSSGQVLSENYEWNFARSFLYSLTVLTTIGKS